MQYVKVIFKPDDREVLIHKGATLLEAASRAGIVLNASCGGKGTCHKCRVILEPDRIEVLACQHTVESDLTVTVPQTSRFYNQKILERGIDVTAKTFPDIWQQYAEHGEPVLGVAVDIGTTTVVARLLDMKTGRHLATESILNPQTQFGDDVVSRITYAQSDDRLKELQKVIVDCLNTLFEAVCKEAGAATDRIFEVSVVCNTTMNHIFLGLPVVQLGQAPYHAHSVDAFDLPPAEIGLKINPAGNVHTVENIAGFVGADTTAVALAIDIDNADEMTLAIDIGTNGEIVLGTREKLYAASCAAGPALEGARISQGSRAVCGAIESVLLNEDDIAVEVIGDCGPQSICGSGLIDSVALMAELGIIDATGRIQDPENLPDLPPKIRERVIIVNDQPAFCLVWQGGEPQVVLTQRDVRETQLAKAAIRAGIKLLEKKLSLSNGDIKHCLIAGAFGNYIKPKNALRIGLLPDVPLERIVSVGNAAGSGAEMTLLNKALREKTKDLSQKIEYVEIAHEPDFTMVYADAMMF